MQTAQPQILGAKIMPPLAHAVGFINREQRELAAPVQGLEQRREAVGQHALGCGVEQREPPGEEILLYLPRLGQFHGGVEKRRRHAQFVQRADLIVPQRDERRDDQRHAVTGALTEDCRQLIANAFTRAGRHQHQRVAAVRDVFDDGLLGTAKRRVTKNFAENRGRTRHVFDNSDRRKLTRCRAPGRQIRSSPAPRPGWQSALWTS